MRRHFGLLGSLLVVCLLLAGAAPVRTASAVSYEDPAGDQVDPRPSMDILRVSWDVRQASQVGRPWLVVEMTLAAPPEQRLASYFAGGNADSECFVEAAYRPGTVFTATTINSDAWFLAGCEPDGDKPGDVVDAKLEIKGNVITMSASLDSITNLIRDSGQLTGLSATAEVAEPVTGIVGPAQFGVVAGDQASTDQTFRYA